MLRNHANFSFGPDPNKPCIRLTPIKHHEFLTQYEYWRGGDGIVRKIDTLDTDHLENLRNFLLNDAYRFTSEAGKRGYTTEQTDSWMRGQPLFISIEHELKVREDREAAKIKWAEMEMKPAKPAERLYAFKYIDNSTRIVWFRRTGYESYDLVDWFSGQILLQCVDGENVFGLQRITV